MGGDKGAGGSPRPRIDYTDKDYESLREAMLALASEKLPAWTDHSANDPGVVLTELFAYMGDVLLYYQDRIANESFLDTAVERRSVMNLLRLIGCELRPSQAASVDLTLLFHPELAGIVTVRGNALFTSVAVGGEAPPVTFVYLGDDQKVDLASLTPQRHENGRLYRFYTIAVQQADAVKEGENVGSSDGSPGQRLQLTPLKPVVDPSIELRVGTELWQRKETLFYSGPESPHYVVRRDESETCWIEFGDGRLGGIPPRGSRITASFRLGGGMKGNLPSKTKFQAVSGLVDPGNALQMVYNENAASGGAEPEEIGQAVQRGPQLFRARSRAVTADDYEAYALDFGVAKVRAVARNWNVVDLYVAPSGGGYPSDIMKERLRLYFEDKRMLTVKVEVQSPLYVRITIGGELYCKRTYLEKEVKQAAEDAVKRLLAFDNVTFGGALYISDLYKAIEEVPGVDGVSLTWQRYPAAAYDVDPDPDRGVLRFDWNEIPDLQDVQLTVNTGGGGRRGY